MNRRLLGLIVVGAIFLGCQTNGLASTNHQTEDKSDEIKAVKNFVRQIYPHGMIYAEARKFGLIPTLSQMLKDPKEEPYWSNIVVTLSLTGRKGAQDALSGFLTRNNRNPSALSLTEYRAETSTLMALGFLIHEKKDVEVDKIINGLVKLINRSRNEKGIENTNQSRNLRSLEGVKIIPAVDPSPTPPSSPRVDIEKVLGDLPLPQEDVLKHQYARKATLGLALSAHKGVRGVLEGLHKQTKPGELFRALIVEALDAFDTIANFDKEGKDGLLCYYNEQRDKC